jgi:DNA-binding XRE family transcriptional regulator
MSTALQIGIEKQRAVYAELRRPVLSQLMEMHRVTIREFAEMMGISPSYCEEIVNEKKFPKLVVALRMCRYWEVTVEELFGWWLDDDGQRRPFVIELPKTGQVIRLNARNKGDETMELVAHVAKILRERRLKEESKCPK